MHQRILPEYWGQHMTENKILQKNQPKRSYGRLKLIKMLWAFLPTLKATLMCHVGKSSTGGQQTSRSCATARPAVIDSGGPSSIVKSPNIRCFVAKSGLSRFTCFLGVRFSDSVINSAKLVNDVTIIDLISTANLFYR